VARLEFDIVGNNASGVRALNQVDTAAGRAQRNLEATGASAERSRGGVSRLAGALGTAARAYGPLAAAAGAGAVLKFGLDSVKAASDTQQAFGAIESVFGKNSATVKGWANNAVSSVGLARSEYGNLAVVLGSMLKNTGIENYSAKTDELIKLGADLAATYGGDVNTAVQAIGATLRGETDPIEQYGVSINQAKVESLLAAQGLSKLTGTARAQAEQQARLTLLTQQTTAAQGAFGRETDTLAGQQQRLGARFTNLKDTLGQKLLPVATRVVSWLSNTIAGTNKTSQTIRTLASAVASYATPVLNAYRSAWQTVSTALNGATGKSNSASSSLKALLKAAGPVASFLGKSMAAGIRTAAGVMAGLITAAGKVASAIRSIVGAVDSAIGALNRLREKASINIPNPLGGLGGLFRSSEGLTRAGGSSLLRAGVSTPIVNLTSAPRVTVNVDSRALRDFLRVQIDDRLAEVFGAVQSGVSS
jgi:hypothetical protein